MSQSNRLLLKHQILKGDFRTWSKKAAIARVRIVLQNIAWKYIYVYICIWKSVKRKLKIPELNLL